MIEKLKITITNKKKGKEERGEEGSKERKKPENGEETNRHTHTHTHNLINWKSEIYKNNLYIKKIKRDVYWLCTSTT